MKWKQYLAVMTALQWLFRTGSTDESGIRKADAVANRSTGK